MKLIADYIIEVAFEELNKVTFSFNKKFGLIVKINEIKYEFLINLKENSDDLLVIGSGAIPPNSKHDRSRPLFHRHSWDFEDSTIFYNDPTLYIDDSLVGPWCIGTLDDWYLENIAKIIESIANNLNISNKNLIFYGSSSGGFTSCLLSVLVKNSIALADIPQLDLTNHYQSHFNYLVEHCFKGLSKKEVIEKYMYRFSVLELIKKENYIPNIYLVCDCSVSYDFDTHYLPFFSSLNNLEYDKDDSIHLFIHGKNIGHKPLNRTNLLKMIKLIKFERDF